MNNTNNTFVEQNKLLRKKLNSKFNLLFKKNLRTQRKTRKNLFIQKKYMNDRNGGRGPYTKALNLVKHILSHPEHDSKQVQQFRKKLVTLINYVWRTTDPAKLSSYEILENNASDFCNKSYVKTLIDQILQMKTSWLARYEGLGIEQSNIDAWTANERALEKQIYDCVDDDTCKEEIHTIIGNNMTAHDSMIIQSYIAAEYAALYNIAQFIALGVVEVNREWFVFNQNNQLHSFKSPNIFDRYKRQCHLSPATTQDQVIELIRTIYTPTAGGRYRKTRKH